MINGIREFFCSKEESKKRECLFDVAPNFYPA